LLDDQTVLATRVAQVRSALGAAAARSGDEVDARVAASVMHLGFVARLASPVLAEAAIYGRLASVQLDQLWWQPALGGAFPLSMPPARDGVIDDDHELARVLERELLDGPIGALTASIGARFRTSPRVLWGNVASALNATIGLIARAYPQRTERLVTIATTIRARAELRGEDAEFGPSFQRRSCCLIYQVAGRAEAGVCADCVLRTRPGDGRV
jgi:hypothetical protein